MLFPKIGNWDWRLFFVPLFLGLIGVFTIFSISREYFLPQLTFLIVGIFVYWVMAFLDLRLFDRFGWWFYAFTILGLLLVLLAGVPVRGSRRWFDFYGIKIQPSEVAKISLSIFYACFWSKIKNTWRFPPLVILLISLVLVVPPLLLIFLEPDLGTAIVVSLAWLPSLFSSQISWKIIVSLAVFALFFSFFSFKFLLHDYQQERVVSFFNHQNDPLGSSYQIRQAIIAVGSGGWFGKGYGYGTQSHLQFLPDHHTDFIFASFAEEWGLVGCSFVIFLFVILGISLINTAKNAIDPFGAYICLAFFLIISLQAIFNFGMNIGFLPVVGIPLPFVSYGGSSLLSCFLMLGIAQNVALRSKV